MKRLYKGFFWRLQKEMSVEMMGVDVEELGVDVVKEVEMGVDAECGRGQGVRKVMKMGFNSYRPILK
jgi:hypothetical protein